ncbi:MAG: DUF4838 domain-containing protein [Planctomycetota bacterium]|nr:DUF4838 domain-containing protein [Planctomycetota bacterium]
MRTHARMSGFLICLAMAAPALAADFVLVLEGRPRAEIVLADAEATGPVLFAAQELQRYVKAISGASLPLVPTKTLEDASVVIITADPDRAIAAGVRRLPADPADHYVLHASDKRIVIVGATPRAALYGTYDLLERLGCGWCVPGDDSIPKRSTLSIASLDVDTAPAFQYRMMLDFPLMSVGQSIAIVDWIAKNRLNWVHPCPNAKGEPQAWYHRRETIVPEIRKRGLNLIFGGHTMHTWLPPEQFKEHPDWFAYNDAERKPPTLCVTNADMTAELIRNMQRFLDRCPEVDIVDLWHPDSDVFCHCPACTQGLLPAEAKGKTPEGTPADAVKSAYAISYIRFMNRVAEAIGKSHPKVMISPLIYGPTHCAMPDGCPELADNLLAGLAHIARDSYRPLAGEPKSAVNMRYLGNDLTWMAKSKHHYIYEYYNCWVAPYIYPGAQVIVQDLRILKALGAQGASSDMYGYTPCNMYVAARVLWSPDISWEAAVGEFHLRYYGDAGREMADNAVMLEKGLYGKMGYGSGGALNKLETMADSGKWLNEIRPRQISFLDGLIARIADPLVKVRLERALKPWKMWNADARWWAFPPFEDRK